jgi:quercetin dioxygenase-like cupin family protein
MIIKNAMSVAPQKVEGVEGTEVRWVIDGNDGAPTFAMRMFDIQPGGYTPLHTHDWEHEIFVMEGECEVASADGPKRAKAGDAVFVPGGELHQFRNSGETLLRVMCLVPIAQSGGAACGK